MSLLRSFGFWRFAIYRDAAPMRLRKGSFWGAGLDWVVEREGFIKCLTVRHLVLAGSVPWKEWVRAGVKGAPGQGTGPTMPVLRTVYVGTVYIPAGRAPARGAWVNFKPRGQENRDSGREF